MALVPDQNRIAADAAVMARIVQGDQGSFARLMAQEAPRLLRLASSLLGDQTEGEEVVQEAFVRLWKSAEAWEPRAQIGTWLHQVTYRLSIDVIRRRRPMANVEDVEAVLADTEGSPEAQALQNERERIVADAMAQLPPRQHAAIMLAHFQGLSQAEAAASLELTEEAYESLLARARRRLKELVMAKDG